MSWRPSSTARVVHRDAELTIYSDGTWTAHVGGTWTAHSDAVVYAARGGDTRITTSTGRSKVSRVTTPSGRDIDVRGIAAGTVKAPA